MKNLLLTLSLIPLIIFAAAPAPSKLGPIEAFVLRRHQEEAQQKAAAQNLVNEYHTKASEKELLGKNMVLLEKNTVSDKALHYLFTQDLVNNRRVFIFNGLSVGKEWSTYWPFQENNMIEYRIALTTLNAGNFSEQDCLIIRNSLLQKLVVIGACDAESRERLREAWATPTDIFPNGRNPKNLILPEVKPASAADNKDQKS